MASLIDLFLHLDKHLVELVTNYGALDIRDPVRHHLCRDRPRRDAVSPGRLAAVCLRRACGQRDAGPLVVVGLADDGGDSGRRRELLGRPLRRPAGLQRRGPLRAAGIKLLNREHLAEAHAFFERHGGKAIVLARFVPIVRTFVPFVAGAGTMTYSAFAFYNVTGGILWVSVCVGAGLRLRQRADGQEQLLARRARDRLRLGPADGDRSAAAPERDVGRVQ